jgi:hypothetical protein
MRLSLLPDAKKRVLQITGVSSSKHEAFPCL